MNTDVPRLDGARLTLFSFPPVQVFSRVHSCTPSRCKVQCTLPSHQSPCLFTPVQKASLSFAKPLLALRCHSCNLPADAGQLPVLLAFHFVLIFDEPPGTEPWELKPKWARVQSHGRCVVAIASMWSAAQQPGSGGSGAGCFLFCSYAQNAWEGLTLRCGFWGSSRGRRRAARQRCHSLGRQQCPREWPARPAGAAAGAPAPAPGPPRRAGEPAAVGGLAAAQCTETCWCC